YVEYYKMRGLLTFGQVIEYVDRERRSHYFDGPEGVEWLFRNTIIDNRESFLYVDYIENNGRFEWRRPAQSVLLFLHESGPPPVPRLLALLHTMHEGGLLSADSLRALGEVWRDQVLEVGTHWSSYLTINEEFLRRRAPHVTLDENAQRYVADSL